MGFIDLSTPEFDSFCRAVKTTIEMTEGPACCTLEFPMNDDETDAEVTIKIVAWRCENPVCEGEVHVDIEVQPQTTRFAWSKERSDDILFGGGEHDPRDA